MIRIYGMKASGNCYKLQLLLQQLGRPCQWVEINSAAGETRSPAYLAKNPNGKVPLLELADGRVLAESNAILCYLAESSDFLPSDAWQRAQALQWMFFEQYSHEPYVAVARFIRGWTPLDSPRRAELPRLHERGAAALAVMQSHLQEHAWFTAGRYGVADIALYAYTHNAADGGFDLARWPAVQAWLERVRGTAGFIPMDPLAEENRRLLDASALN